MAYIAPVYTFWLPLVCVLKIANSPYQVKDEVKAENGQTVCSGEIMAKILKFLLTRYPTCMQEFPKLHVLTIPSTTVDQIGARRFIEHAAKKVPNQTFWFQSVIFP